MMSLGAIVGERALAEFCSLKNLSQFETTKSDACMSLGYGQVCRTGGQENDDPTVGVAGVGVHFLMLFILMKFAFPFFTLASWFFAQVVIALQGFFSSAALGEMLS